MYRDSLYKPPMFDLGLILPQPIMIFIITILYSAISTKILVSGLVYFTLGFYTYKYQLVYSLVHPFHSTGKAWPIIFKRVCLGVFFLHLQMFGSLALEQSFVLAGLMLPLFPTTVIALLFFDRNYKPLLHYIALDAIKTRGKSVDDESVDDGLNGLLTSSGLPPSNSLKRKTSAVSFNRLLDGDEQCDAVIMNESDSNLSIIEEDSIEDDNDSTFQERLNGIMNDQSPESNISKLNPSRLTGDVRLRRRCSTIEEEREANQSYTHPCLLDPCQGLMVGFERDAVDYLNFRILHSSEIPNSAETSAINIVQQNGSELLDEHSDNHDIEFVAAEGQIEGFITRDNELREVW